MYQSDADTVGNHASEVNKNPQISKAIRYFFAHGEVFELCVLGPRVRKSRLWDDEYISSGAGKKGLAAGWFDDPAKAASIAAQADSQVTPEGIYLTLNPVNPALLGRANNRLKAGAARTNDSEITTLRQLYIDADPTRPAGVSSSDAEKAAAIDLLNHIRTHLANLGWPEPLFAESGNGGHLIYRLLDLTNTQENIDLIKSCLQALAAQYDTDQIKIDQKVFNPARISKLYGTHARKGDSTPNRPHRLAQIISAPAQPTPVPMDLIHSLAALAPKPEPKPSPHPASTTFHGDSQPLDVPAYLAKYGRTLLKTKQHGTSTLFILDECVFNPDHKGGEAAIGQTADGKLFYQCYHNSCNGHTWHDARQLISGDEPLFEKAYLHKNTKTYSHNKQFSFLHNPTQTQSLEPPRSQETSAPDMAAKLAAHRSVLDTATRVEEKDGVLKLIKYDNKLEMETETIVSSFKIEPFESVYIDGEGQYVKAHLQNCKKRREVTFNPDCWTSANKFLKTLPDVEFSFTGDLKTVQLVKRHVAHFDLEQKSGTRTAGFHPTPTGELQFVTEHGALTPSGVRTDLVYLNEIPSGCSLQQIEPAMPDALASLNPILFNFNSWEVTLPVLGWATACFFKDRIHAEYKSFPLLNIEGEAGAGKSSTAREIIMRLWGITSAPRAIAEQTKFTMMRQVSASNTIPLIYEENKSTKMNEKQVQMVSNLIRDTYNAFEGQRGYADQTMRTYRYDAPVCIIGETGFSEPALLDRLCTVSLSRNTSKSFLEHFRALKSLPLESLGRTLLDHALHTDAQTVAAGIEAELSQVDPKLSDRPRLNAAIIRFGLRTLVRVLGAEAHISDDEIRSIDQAVIHTTSDEDGPTRKSAVDKILEHISRMATFNETESAKDWFVSEDFRLREGLHYSVTKEGNIRIRLPEVYPILRSWAQRTGYTEDIINEATFKKQVKGEKYFVSLGKMRIGSSNNSARGVELILPLLFKQGLFPSLEANNIG